jgi:hypothetical protein
MMMADNVQCLESGAVGADASGAASPAAASSKMYNL